MAKEKYSNSAYMVPASDEIVAGSDRLISRDEWLTPEAFNTEEKTLDHAHFKQAFEAVNAQHRPQHDVCFVSLCTASRPYEKSQKYKKLIPTIGDNCDIVINSSGGVVPIGMQSCYPFLTYDGNKKTKRSHELYYYVVGDRLYRFLQKHRYKYVVVNFHKGQRNYKYACEVLAYCLAQGYIEGYRFAPSEGVRNVYDETKQELTYYQRFYPDISDLILADIVDAVTNPQKGAIL